MSDWKPGKGNHRRGLSRGSKSGRRRGTLPAHRDPVIIGRRALAAPLWLNGSDGVAVQNRVNSWLQEHGELPVSLDTIRRDKREIEAQWRADGADTISEARATHIARLERLMSRLWVLFDRAEAEGVNCVPLADQLRKIEMDISDLDSTRSAARVHVTTDENPMERFLASIAIPLPPEALKVIPLLEDDDFATYRELPAPIRGDG